MISRTIQTARVPDSTNVSAFGCPSCGGSLELFEGAPVLRCGYCGSAYLAEGLDGVFRFLARATQTPDQIERTVRELMRSPLCPGDLPSEASRVSCEVIYIPFWRFRATFVGRAKGIRDIVRRRFCLKSFGAAGGDESLRPLVPSTEEVVVGHEDVDLEIQHIWKATVSACPLEDLGIPRLGARRQMAGGLSRLAVGAGDLPLELVSGDGPDGVLVDPMIALHDARAEADTVFDAFIQGRGADLREKHLTYERLQDRQSLLFYPIYRVRFQYRGRLYQATVDGLEGHVVHARLPADTAGTALPALWLASMGGASIGQLARGSLASASSLWMLAAAIIGAVGLACGLRWIAKRTGRRAEDLVVTA